MANDNKNNKNNNNHLLQLIASLIGVIVGLFLFALPYLANDMKPTNKTLYERAIEEGEVIPYLEYEELLAEGAIDDILYCQTNEKMVCTLYNDKSRQAELDGVQYQYSVEECVVTDYPANTDFRLGVLKQGVGLTRIVLEADTIEIIVQTAVNMIPLALFLLMFIFIYQQSQLVGNVKENDIMQTSDISFDDIIGLEEVKEELDIIVSLIKNTVDGTDIGARVPHGILLSGPPGVGKTMIAKAVSNAAGIPFINVGGSDFQEIYVGSGAKRVRELFAIARKKAPCIIFIDEFDAIGAKRSSNSAHSEDVKTINALLKELDGFKKLEKVFVLAATNYPENLDKAVIRSGRFDREISIQPPKDWEDRAALFNFYLKDKKVSDDIDVEIISKTLSGYTGADIAMVCNEAALVALGKGKAFIDMDCMETAIDKKIFKGSYSKKKVNKEDLKIVAYHEAGHAVATILLGDKVSRASIKSTTSGVGGAVFGSDTDSQFMTKNRLISQIKIAYAGRAAEEIFFKDVTTGAGSDIVQASEYLKKYVMFIGFDSDSALINWSVIDHHINDDSKRKITELSKQFYKETLDLLSTNKHLVDRLAQALLQKETMSGTEVEELIKSEMNTDVTD